MWAGRMQNPSDINICKMKCADLNLVQDHITLLLVMQKILTDPRCLYFYEFVWKWEAEEKLALLKIILQEWLEIKTSNRFLSQSICCKSAL